MRVDVGDVEADRAPVDGEVAGAVHGGPRLIEDVEHVADQSLLVGMDALHPHPVQVVAGGGQADCRGDAASQSHPH